MKVYKTKFGEVKVERDTHDGRVIGAFLDIGLGHDDDIDGKAVRDVNARLNTKAYHDRTWKLVENDQTGNVLVHVDTLGRQRVTKKLIESVTGDAIEVIARVV